MKKALILLVLLLSACKQELLVIEDEIVTEMEENVTSFEVHEVFILEQFGKKNDLPHNRKIEIDNTIQYDLGLIQTDNSMNESLTVDSNKFLKDYEFESYVDLFNNIGYIKGEDSPWYEFDLSNIFKVGMGSIDPLSIVNSLLYESKSLTFRNETGYSGPLENYDRAVAVIDEEVFENMFVSSVFSFLEIDDYNVTATLKFDEQYRVEYIEFDLSELKDNYERYYKYELKTDITSFICDLRIDFSKYNETSVEFPSEVINWDGEETPLMIDEIRNNFYIGEVIADVIYDANRAEYEANVSLELTEDVKYLSFELFYLSDGELIKQYPSEVNNVKASENVLLHYFESDKPIEHIYFKMRYIPVNTTQIIDVSEKVNFDIEEPAHDVDPDLDKFNDETQDLVPSILIEHTTFDKGEKVYEINVDLFSKEDIRNGEVILYLYDDTELKTVISKFDLVMEQYESISFKREIDFIPSEIYVEIRYNTSFFWYNEQFIKADFKQVDGSFDSTDYKLNDDVSVNVVEIEDSKWRAYKYSFYFDFSDYLDEFDAYIFFAGENNNIIGWEYIHNVSNINSYEYVSELYEKKVKYVYIDLEVKGEILENYKIKGEFTVPID